MRILRSTQGFSLIEALIVMGLLSVTATGALGVVTYLFKGMSEMKSNLAARDLVEDMRQHLSFNETCDANLKDLDIDNVPLVKTTLVKNDGTLLYALNSMYEDRQLELQEMFVTNYQLFTGLRGRMDLHIRLRKVRETGGAREVYRRIPIMVTLDNATDRRISSCYAIGGGSFNAEKTCEELGGRYVAGTTVGAHRCIFPQLVVTDDNALVSSPATLHVRSGTTDLLTATTTGSQPRVAVNYPVGSVPSDSGTSLYVNGDQRVSGTTHVDRIFTEFLGIGPAADLETLATNVGITSGRDWAQFSAPMGQMGMGDWFGQYWFDGGGDGVAQITNTSEISANNLGGLLLGNAYDSSRYPYPYTVGTAAGENKVVSFMNDGRVGVGFNIKITHESPIPAYAAGAMNAARFPDSTTRHNYSNVKLFTRGSARIETDMWVRGNVLATTWSSPSDQRWKEDVEPIRDAAEGIGSLEGSSYLWKKGRGASHLMKGRDIGFIAQEVEKYFPEAVDTDAGGYKYVSYTRLLPVLWEAFKDRHQKNESLKKRVAKLKALTCREHPAEKICQPGEAITSAKADAQ